MDAEKIEFPQHFFNVVSNRHCGFNANEVARVLAKDGFFLTQQVSEHDKLNLKQAFGRGQSSGIQDGMLKKEYISELSKAGFTDIHSRGAVVVYTVGNGLFPIGEWIICFYAA